MGWGGARPGAGRRKLNDNEPKKVTSVSTETPRSQVGDVAAIERIIAMSQDRAREKKRTRQDNPFKLPAFPKAAMPPKAMQMAMDDNITWAQAQWSESPFGLAQEGLLFLGYPYLSELAQRPEYRTFSETIATEMTRKWIKFTAVGEDAERLKAGDKPKTNEGSDQADRIKELTDFCEHLQVRDRFAELAVNDGLFGRSHLYFDLGIEGGAELSTPIGNGRDNATAAKVTKGSLKKLKVIEPVWTYPTTYNAISPLRPDWYDPQVWYVMGEQIHRSRLLPFVGRPVPDLLKPAYSFGGLSMTQMAKPYVDIWLKTRQSVADLIHSFSVMVLCTDLQTMLQPGAAANLLARVALFNELRDNQGAFVVNKNSEDFKNVSAPLSGLHELQSQAQEHMMSVARIPSVKFTGMSPQGMNASGEGEIRAFYDTIHAYQNKFFRPGLTTTIDFAQITLWGQRDESIKWDFEPLWEMTAKEKGEKQKGDAERDQIFIDSGQISPAEARKRIIDDPELPYGELDPEEVPDLAEEEAEGLEPEGGRPDPGAKGEEDTGGGANDAVLPFAEDAEWNESDHPRAPDGKFGSGGGSSGGPIKAPQFGMPFGKFTATGPSGGFSSSPKRGNIGADLDE